MTEPSLLDQIRIPTAPGYDFAKEPEENPSSYINPVTLSNQLALLSNANGRVTERILKLNTRLGRGKRELADAEANLEDFEQELLVTHPPGPNDRKSNKLLDAYICRIAHEGTALKGWRDLRERVRKLKGDADDLQVRKDNAYQVLNHIKLQSENIKTVLAFEKYWDGRR